MPPLTAWGRAPKLSGTGRTSPAATRVESTTGTPASRQRRTPSMMTEPYEGDHRHEQPRKERDAHQPPAERRVAEQPYRQADQSLRRYRMFDIAISDPVDLLAPGVPREIRARVRRHGPQLVEGDHAGQLELGVELAQLTQAEHAERVGDLLQQLELRRQLVDLVAQESRHPVGTALVLAEAGPTRRAHRDRVATLLDAWGRTLGLPTSDLARWRAALARLPQVAIEHHWRRPLRESS